MTNEDAIRVFESWIEQDKNLKYADRLENIEIYQIAIEALKAQRPHGKWIACEDTEFCKCSNCGDVVMFEESVRFYFCPKCGTPMTDEALDILRKRSGVSE